MVTAGEASARPRVTMAPEQPALPALAAICCTLLDAVELNAAGVRGDLEPFRALLVERRRDAHAALVTALDSARYRELVRGWRAFLEAAAATGGAGPTPAGGS